MNCKQRGTKFDESENQPLDKNKDPFSGLIKFRSFNFQVVVAVCEI
jgi:hypothetical protein